ncbi:MAG: hypothetical protein AAF236_03670 [Verrucomicrobiota bacterium]
MIRLLSLLTLSAVTAALVPQTRAETGVATTPSQSTTSADYIRFEGEAGDGETDRLQTAVTRFQKEDLIVDLVAVVHLAEQDYFEGINGLLSDYDVVLYEMVGGEFDPERAAQALQSDPSAGGLESLQGIQQVAKSLLGLSFQLEAIDYAPDNFVHADLTLEEFTSLSATRDESFANLMARASELSEQGGLAGIPTDETAMNELIAVIMNSLMTGDSNGLKRAIAPILSESESLIAEFEGEDGSVIVSERNRVVMEKLAVVLAEGHKKVAVFYGAGHMPDLETRLLALDYTKSSEAWLDAWTIAEGATTPAPGTAPDIGQLMQLIMDLQPQLEQLMESFDSAP